jgi:hypothetical protein
MKLRPLFGRYRVESGRHWLVMSISAFDPKRTSLRPRTRRNTAFQNGKIGGEKSPLGLAALQSSGSNLTMDAP